MVKTKPKVCPTDYLMCREQFIIAHGKHARVHEKLMSSLGCESEAGLSRALLEVDGRHPCAALVDQWQNAETELDQAEKLFNQARKVLADKKALDSIISSLDE